MNEFLISLIDEMRDATSWGIEGIVEKPKGDIRDCSFDDSPYDHSYIEQQRGFGEDDFHGNQYFPIEDGLYLNVWFMV